MRNWPFAVSLALGLIPVALFAGMVTMLVVNSLPALDRPGLNALSADRFTSTFTTTEGLYGLRPALWGTIMITAIAIGLALPVSLAMAIISSEFPLGPVGRVLRLVVGVLSGIPPIVYAVSGIVFVTQFMIPKFAADSTFGTFDPARLGVAPAQWPPSDVPWNAGAFPWDLTGVNNSTLLGGALIALLVIPFMTPLIGDAMRNVPSAAKEASFALGANRGYTLRKVILPLAMPGIVASLALGTLKALGDTLIVIFAVGWEANVIPDPVVDVLERTSSLTALGSGLLGGFQRNTTCGEPDCSVGYASALVLLVIATLVVLAMTFLQARLRRRLRA